MERNYSVYKHTTPNGKVYIGLTGIAPKDRWDSGHGYKNNRHFTSAIKKYGWNNIIHEIVQDNLTANEASDLERELIIKYDSTNPARGYNFREGGTLGFRFQHTDETKQKISEASQRLWNSEEHRQRMSQISSGENNPFYGKHHTEETRERLRQYYKDHPFSQEKINSQVENMRQANLGRKMSRESVEKSAKSKYKQVAQYNKNGEFLRIWSSAKEACESLHINKSTLCQCCKGVKPSAGGYIWKYAL